MAYIVTKSMIATIYKQPVLNAERDNEALHGEILEIVENLPSGWVKVRTRYMHEGYALISDFITCENDVALWRGDEKKIVNHRFADVLSEPSVRAAVVCHLTKGCSVVPICGGGEDWAAIKTADGEEGFIRRAYLETPVYEYNPDDENNLRDKLTGTAISFLGTQYRWGGKTPMGIDCAGLCAMSLMLNGIIVFNGMVMLDRIEKAPPLHKIPLSEIKKGDFLFWSGHVAMYLGDGKYIHASGSKNGVVISSLNPGEPGYDKNMSERITGAGSIFYTREDNK